MAALTAVGETVAVEKKKVTLQFFKAKTEREQLFLGAQYHNFHF